MSYDVNAFLRYVIKAGNDVAPNGFLGQGYSDDKLPDEFRAFVNDLVDRGVVEDTMRRGWGSSMPVRLRVTAYGRSLI